MPCSSVTRIFNESVSPRRTWGTAILAFDRINTLRKIMDVSVNDLILAICAGGIRKYLEEKEKLPVQPLVANVPISIRVKGDKQKMDNQISNMLVKIATHIKDPIKRLEYIQEQTNMGKSRHKAVGAKITIDKMPHKAYSGSGAEGLINGINGSDSRYGDKEWLGFWGEDIIVTINFSTPKEINSISTRFHNGNGQWIYAPEEIGFSFKLQEDGRTLNDINRIKNNGDIIVNHSYKIEPTTVSQIEIVVKNYGEIPEGKQGAGNKAWTFIDEIIIN